MEANANGVNGKGNAGKSDAATAQFPAAISNGSSNRLKSDCQDPSVINDASCEGTTFWSGSRYLVISCVEFIYEHMYVAPLCFFLQE
jgi:hypothetical protein